MSGVHAASTAESREAGIAQRQTAAVYPAQLCKAGVLDEVKVGREKLFINPRLMRFLTMERPGNLSFPAPVRKRKSTAAPASFARMARTSPV